MDYSFLSIHESSICLGDKSQSFMQTHEAESQFSEYSNIVDYQPSSKIIEICNKFREITKYRSANNNYMAMIKNYIGNLSHYLNCVTNNIGLFSHNSDGDLTLISSLIINEVKTWKLINQIYEDRFKHVSAEIIAPVARTSELDLVRDLYENNTYLRESQIVVDWLEDGLKEFLDKNVTFLMATDGKSWEHTKHTIRRKNTFTFAGNCAVNELDPDAPLRGKLSLNDSDKNDESEYLRYVFHCLQCGDIEKAQIGCQNHEEFWRALSLDGWRPFHNPLINDDQSHNVDVIGNSNRDAFKSVCYQLSEDTQLNIYERAIYAMFCGNISVLSLVLKDWHSLLWAYLKSYTEHVVDDYLHTFTINGSFATQSLFGGDDDDMDLGSLGLSGKLPIRETLSHWTREQIFDDIASKLVHSPLETIKMGIRPGTKPQLSFYLSIFEVVQQLIIVNDIEGLVFYIDLAISKLPTKKTAADKLILRFLAHAVMFVYSTHVDMEMDVYHRVLERYIECLIEERSLENISFYVSKLSTDLQIKWYCKAMAGVTGYEDKRRCVLEGIEYDLPMVEISRIVVQSIRMSNCEETAGPQTLRGAGAGGHQLDATGLVTDADQAKIAGLDWLTIVPEQHCHLVRQTNALCRLFLDNDKLQAAKMALTKTSNEIVTRLQNNAANEVLPSWLPNVIYENDCLKAFISAYDAFVDWQSHCTKLKPAKKDFTVQKDLNKLSFQEKQALQKEFEDHTYLEQLWEKSAEYYGNRVLDLFVSTLRMGERGWLSDMCPESDWSEDDHESMVGRDNDGWRRRLQQVERLQRKNVVSMTFLLMKVLAASDSSRRCFQVTDLLADDRLRLYEHFEKSQLQRLLQQVRQCSLAMMSAGNDAFGTLATVHS